MKNLFLALIALTSLVEAAPIRPLPGPIPNRPIPHKIDERLRLVIAPKAPRPGAPISRLIVARNGSVVKTVCQAILPRPCTTQLVTRLPLHELNVIETLIRDARLGEIANRKFGVHCMAVSADKKTLSADNGRVFLREVDVTCPAGERVNVSGAAGRLIHKLERLSKLAQKPGIRD